MKRIETVIKPSSVNAMQQALTAAGVTGLSLSDVRSLGSQKSRMLYRGTEYVVDFTPKVRLEILVPNDLVNSVVKIIRSVARSTHLGDELGTILVFPVEGAHSVFSVATTVG
ncbi:MAG TPA: P-II family nitrogen regulator [Myxococcales bacterium]